MIFKIATIVFILTFKLINGSEYKEELKILEREKDKLFHEIQKGIKDSIDALTNDSDKETKLGATYLIELGKQLNETENLNVTNLEELKKNFENRRKNKLKLKHEDISFLFTTKAYNIQKVKEKNKVTLHKKLEDWIKQREEEKARIKQYKDRLKIQNLGGTTEKCPRFGIGEAKMTNLDDRKSGKNVKAKYPCCRKCCKKSYLGCL